MTFPKNHNDHRIEIGDDWSITEQTPSGPLRRTIVQGAAWTIPVIAGAMAAPMAAASTEPTCPTVAPSSEWTAQIPYGGNTLEAGGNTGAYQDGANSAFQSQRDSSAPYGTAVRFTTSVDLVAGETYSFTFLIRANYANGGGTTPTTRQRWRFQVGGQTLYYGSTRTDPDYALIPVNSGWASVTETFTATTSGPTLLEYLFELDARPYSNNAGNDDVYVTVPTITCV